MFWGVPFTETKVNSGTSQSQSGTTVNLSNSGFFRGVGDADGESWKAWELAFSGRLCHGILPFFITLKLYYSQA